MIREFDAFRNYDRKGSGRSFTRGWRGVQERLVAAERGEAYYHGDRRFGYGGYRDLGRWGAVASDLIQTYGLSSGDAVLQIGCDFGFLLTELQNQNPQLRLAGLDPSTYAVNQLGESVRHLISRWEGPQVPFADNTFDLVICAGYVYTLVLADAFTLIQEIMRVGRRDAYLVLASYETAQDLEAFREWTLLGETVLRKEQWEQLLSKADYTGDVKFTSAADLGLSLDDGSTDD